MTAETRVISDAAPDHALGGREDEIRDFNACSNRQADLILQALSRRVFAPRDGESRKTLSRIYQSIRIAQDLNAKGSLGERQRATIERLLDTNVTKLGLDAILAVMEVW